MLAATCNNIGKDCSPTGAPAGPTFPFFGSSLQPGAQLASGGRNLSCSSPPNTELKLPSPLSHQQNRLRLPSEPESQNTPMTGIMTSQPVSSMANSLPKLPTNTVAPSSFMKYMDKLSPIAATPGTPEYTQQLQAKFASALAAGAGNPHSGPTSLTELYDPLKLAAAIQQAKSAAAAAYMFPPSATSAAAAASNPLSALASLTSGTAPGLHSASNNPNIPSLNPNSNSSAASAGSCQMCPTGGTQFAAGGHSPSKPGAGSPYITFVPVKTSSGSTALVPVCADRGCLNCITAIRQAQLSSGLGATPNCSHCNSSDHHSKTSLPQNLSAASIPGCGLNPPAASLLANPLLGTLNLQAALQNSPSLAAVYQQLAAANATVANSDSAISPGSVSEPRAFSPKQMHQELHKCKWAPIGGGQPCGKVCNSADDLMDHIKLVHMNTSPANHTTQNRNPSPTAAVSSALEEVASLQNLVNSNRRLSPSVIASQPSGVSTLSTSTNSFLGSLTSLSAANTLASLSNSLSRKIPGTMDLASALSAARFHPYSKFSLPTLTPSAATPLVGGTPSLNALGGGASNPAALSGLSPANLNALLNSAAASSFLMYDLPKA